jgi:hypothetical protein
MSLDILFTLIKIDVRATDKLGNDFPMPNTILREAVNSSTVKSATNQKPSNARLFSPRHHTMRTVRRLASTRIPSGWRGTSNHANEFGRILCSVPADPHYLNPIQSSKALNRIIQLLIPKKTPTSREVGVLPNNPLVTSMTIVIRTLVRTGFRRFAAAQERCKSGHSRIRVPAHGRHCHKPSRRTRRSAQPPHSD